MTKRTEILKKGRYYKSVNLMNFRCTDLFKAKAMPVLEYRPGIKVCTERARLVTESYKTTEGQPMAIRRAKALYHILDNMTVYISDGELIVGNYASNPWSLPLFPDIGHGWVVEALDLELSDMLDEKAKEECREIFKYWEGKSQADRLKAALPEELKPFTKYNGVFSANPVRGFFCIDTLDVRNLLSIGLNGIIEKIENNLKHLDSSFADMNPRDYVEKKLNWEAMIIALKAAIRFGQRYAEKAREMAKSEKNKKRKQELLRIAEACEWVPGNPPRTLQEAIQSCFFCDLISKKIAFNGLGFGLRLDTLLNPFYQEDKEAGRITREEAQELVECLLIKLSERGHLVYPGGVGAYPGNAEDMHVTIGGVTPEGEDAANEFSFIVIDAAQETPTPQPGIALRYHSNISRELISRAIDLIRTGIGYPAFFNDSPIIDRYVKMGVPLEEARDYAISSCVNCVLPRRNMRSGFSHSSFFDTAKCMELALSQGRDKDSFTGLQLGAKTPDPRTFTCIEDVLEAYLSQVRFCTDKIAKMLRLAYAVAETEQTMKRPFRSAFLDECLEKGKDCMTLGNNLYVSNLSTGNTNVADSLAAIKKFVFDDKSLTMEELVEACRTNFEGREDLRQRLINEAPKFGNDDDDADELARAVQVGTNNEFMNRKDYFGFPLTLSGSIAGGYFGFSRAVGATPDGRKDSDSLADGVISPMAGRDKKGPTAVLNSVSKVPPVYDLLFNQKFLPMFLEGENKKIFAQYLKTWADLGIYHIQFNVVSRDTLLDAQAHPEQYSDLIVRVAGYSAYFVDLAKGIQDDIIGRTEQSL